MKNFIISFILIFISFTSIDIHSSENQSYSIVRRAAIDVGSGAIKVAIADVDITSNKIVTMISEHSYPVSFQASLETSQDACFDNAVMQDAIEAFREIKFLANTYNVEQIQAIATEAFRIANNAPLLAAMITEETGINFTIISQREEGVIAFYSGASKTIQPKENLIIWDIGTGSFQLSTINTNEEILVFMGHYGSIPFRNYIVEIIQKKDLDLIFSPNPLTEEDLKEADQFARSIARKAFPYIKQRIKEENIAVKGIGRLFGSSIAPLSSNNIITRKTLRKYIESCINLSDQDLNNPFSHVDVSNAILVLSFMKALHIHEVEILPTTSAEGLLIYQNYWAQKSFN